MFSDDGDLPKNIESNTVYFVIRISSTEIKLASSVTNAQNNVAITVFGGTKLFVGVVYLINHQVILVHLFNLTHSIRVGSFM